MLWPSWGLLLISCSAFVVDALSLNVTRAPATTVNYDQTNGLHRNGTNVCTYVETISREINETYLTQRWVIVYRKTCSWLRCKTLSREITRHFPASRMVTKYFDRDVYFCCSGWQRKDQNDKNCEKPICSIKCQNGGRCVGPNKCECRQGYSGTFCQIENNECNNPKINHCEQNCIDRPGGISCSCNRGFKLHSDGKSCMDINECTSNQSPCGCVKNDPECQAQCINTRGSYRCQCSKGFYLNSVELCEDINECARDQTLCDHKCVNLPGSYKCECFPGYKQNKMNGGKCEDINECLINNGGCSDNCININGSHVCTCPKGKYLVDERTCKDIDLNSKSALYCEADMFAWLDCQNMKAKINVTNALYGRLSNRLCPTTKNVGQLDCVLPNALQHVKTTCNGSPSCLFMLSNFPDPCPGVEKYAKIDYRCEV